MGAHAGRRLACLEAQHRLEEGGERVLGEGTRGGQQQRVGQYIRWGLASAVQRAGSGSRAAQVAAACHAAGSTCSACPSHPQARPQNPLLPRTSLAAWKQVQPGTPSRNFWLTMTSMDMRCS